MRGTGGCTRVGILKKVAIRARTQSVSDDGSGRIVDSYKRNPRCLCVHDSGA